jgi:hypothetical protein
VRLAVALLFSLHTTLALAGPDVAVAPIAQDAARLFDEGRALKAAGKMTEACQKFEVSWRAERAAGTEVNLADCREREGRLAEAWQLFDEAARISEQQGNRARADFARNRANAIDARLMTVEVRLAEPLAQNVSVTIDGKAARTQRLEPKSVWVRAAAPGGKSYAVFVQAQPGKIVVDVPTLVRATTHRRRTRLYISGGLAAVALTSFVISARLYSLADELRDNVDGCTLDASGHGACDTYSALLAAEDKLQLAEQNETAAGYVLAGGVLAVVGAAVVWYTAPKERVVVTPTATTSSVGVSLLGHF